MAFLSLDFSSYRNIVEEEVGLDAQSIFIVGENGQGKTNFLDSIYTLCYGSSFRHGTDSDVARTGSDFWALRALTADLTKMSVSWSQNTKTIKLDGKQIRDRKILVEMNPAVVFCHDDMEFARGEPEKRRFFFDQTASLLYPSYIDTLRFYKRTLKNRNIALKEHSIDVLDVLDIQLAMYGLSLTQEREKLVNEFDKNFAPRYEAVSLLGKRISVLYKPSWSSQMTSDDIISYLRSSRDRELAFGTTLSGPHRDKYIFVDDDGNFADRASTGQLRLLSLTLRIVQAEKCTEVTGKKPILLLDDVLLELDPDKRTRFMKNLPPADQCFFTFLPGEPYKDYIRDTTIVYWTEHGRFSNTQNF